MMKKIRASESDVQKKSIKKQMSEMMKKICGLQSDVLKKKYTETKQRKYEENALYRAW